ncbi:MAG: hypothetical protein II882_01320 [Lachnospiraceae bacterium]|nr:hypothetical protein [Lachnospiraceae bacterium]
MKKVRFLLLTALCLVLAAGVLHTRAADTDEIENGDVVRIGSYPQSRVTNTSLISSLNGVSKSWKKYPYYSKNTSSSSIPAKLDTSMMDYADFTYNGVKYRAVRINKWRPSDVTGIADNVSDSKQQINGYTKGTVYYFIWEPIEWIVLKKSDGIVISKKVLDAQPFNAYFQVGSGNGRYLSTRDEDKPASAWHYSTVRDWLNGDDEYYEQYAGFNFYYSAFTSSERSAIQSQTHTYTVELEMFISYDSVFLPLESEVSTYKSYITSAENTAYAESQGKSRPGSSGGNYWYTSKAANDKRMYYCVDQSTAYSDSSYSSITSTITGIRPMLKLDLTSDEVIGPFTIRAGSVSRTPFLLWDVQDDATGFDVYRCPGDKDPDAAANWTKLTTEQLEGTAEYYDDTSAVTEKSYYYAVTKYTSWGSERSKPVKAYCRLGIPTITASNDTATGKPVLSWNAVNKADGYLVYRKLYGGYSTTLLTDSPITELTFTDETASTGYQYGYWVRSWSSLGSDYYSVHFPIGNGTTAYCILGTPQITVSTYANGKPQVSWSAIDGADKYEVEYRIGTSGSWNVIQTTAGTSYTYFQASTTDGSYFRVKALTDDGEEYSSKYSNIVSWTPNIAITSHPKDYYVLSGETVSFSVSAQGVGLQYQWYYKKGWTSEEWTAVSAASGKTDTYSLTAALRHDGNWYYCRITDANGNTRDSNIGDLWVLGIKTQPKDISTVAGKKVTFSVEAGGGDLDYQWQYRKAGEIAWANVQAESGKTANYSLTAAARHNGYAYRCKVKSPAGVVTTKTVTLSVLGYTAQPSSKTVAVGSKASFKVKACGDDISYQWYYKVPGSTQWKPVSAESGKTAKYTLTTKAKHNGYEYRCKITNSAGSLKSDIVTLTVVSHAPTITTQPKSASVAVSKKATFTVAASGEGLSYQWYYKKPGTTEWVPVSAASGKTASYSLTVEARHNGYQYYCVVTNLKGSVTSKTVKLTVKTS